MKAKATAARATPNHIDSRQPSTSASRAAAMTDGADSPELGAAANADPMPSSTWWATSGASTGGRRRHARAVAGVDQRAEQGDADGAAELADGVVERRGDTLLLGRQRLGDRRRRRAHQQADADAEHEQARAAPTSSRPRPTPSSPASPARRRTAPIPVSSTARRADRLAIVGATPTAASSPSPSAAARRRPAAPSSRARPGGTGRAPGRSRTSRRTRCNNVREPAARARSANRRISSSGCSWRSSHATNPTSGDDADDEPGERQASVQPRSGPSWMPSTRRADGDAPTGTSRRCRSGRACVLAGVGDRPAASARARRAANSTGMAKSHGQVK